MNLNFLLKTRITTRIKLKNPSSSAISKWMSSPLPTSNRWEIKKNSWILPNKWGTEKSSWGVRRMMMMRGVWTTKSNSTTEPWQIGSRWTKRLRDKTPWVWSLQAKISSSSTTRPKMLPYRNRILANRWTHSTLLGSKANRRTLEILIQVYPSLTLIGTNTFKIPWGSRQMVMKTSTSMESPLRREPTIQQRATRKKKGRKLLRFSKGSKLTQLEQSKLSSKYLKGLSLLHPLLLLTLHWGSILKEKYQCSLREKTQSRPCISIKWMMTKRKTASWSLPPSSKNSLREISSDVLSWLF